MESTLAALLIAAISLAIGAYCIRLSLQGLERPSHGLNPRVAPCGTGLNWRELDLPADRDIQFVHSEHAVEGWGASRRQVTRVTQYTVKAKASADLAPVEWLPADSRHQVQRDRLQRAYEVHDIDARWQTAPPPAAQRPARLPVLIEHRRGPSHWLA